MLQARLGPRPISIFSTELHHPESLAPNSQLPLWSISRWRLYVGAFFRDMLTNRGGVQKSNSHIPREHPVLSVSLFISGFAENLPPHLVLVTRRAELTFACLRRWEEMSAGREIHPPFSTSCCRAGQHAPVPSGCEQAETNFGSLVVASAGLKCFGTIRNSASFTF